MPKLTHTIYISIIAILGVAIVWLVLSPSSNTSQNSVARTTPSTIAILPFIAQPDDDSTRQLAETITAKIFDLLGRESHLTIASKDETRALVGEHLNIRDIGERLSVATVLEGGVHQSHDRVRVRVTVQLIDARTDDHLWAESFEWRADDLDGLVAEIGQAIASFPLD